MMISLFSSFHGAKVICDKTTTFANSYFFFVAVGFETYTSESATTE
jgi:hypothetical protein